MQRSVSVQNQRTTSSNQVDLKDEAARHFVWTHTAEDILASIERVRPRTSQSGRQANSTSGEPT